MKYVFDFDGTITMNVEKELDKDVELNEKITDRMNALYDAGHKVIIYTSRGMKSYNGNIGEIQQHVVPLIGNILTNNHVKYSKIIIGKEPYDVYVDDLAIHPDDFVKQKHILIGKFGRKVIFNKDDFSNKGGHFEILGMIDFLKEQHKLYVFGDYDEIPKHKNIVEYHDGHHKDTIDLILIDNGVGAWQDIAKSVNVDLLDNTYRMCNQISQIKAPALYSLTDPRLDIKQKALPNKVYTLHQNSNADFRGHQEKLCLLTLDKHKYVKHKKDSLVIIGRDNGRAKEYDKYITMFRGYVHVDVYGNFDLKENKDCLRGELKADEVGQAYAKAKYTFMIPVEKGWLTQKFYEALHYHTIPLLHPTYDSDNRLETRNVGFLRIKDKLDVHDILEVRNYYEMLYACLRRLPHCWYDKEHWLKHYNQIFDDICQ